MAFNPYLNTDLKNVLAQGANVGDVRNYMGQNFDWTGAAWVPSGGGGGGSSTGNWEEILNKTISMAQKAAEPAVATLKSSIDPLKQRYTDLLASIKGEQTTATNQMQQIIGQELGKRGLLPSSTLAMQEKEKAIQPITSQYNTLYANTGMGQEKDIGNINSTIAQILANAAQGGMTTGSGIYSQGLNYDMNRQQLEAAKSQQAIQNAIAQQQLANETRQTDYTVNRPYYEPKTPSTGSGVQTNDLTALNQIFGANASFNGGYRNTQTGTTFYPAGFSSFTPRK